MWISARAKTLSKKQKSDEVEVTVLCDICGKRLAKHTCRLCGRRVCNEDFDEKLGICKSCKLGRK
jgi:hypothetical protein